MRILFFMEVFPTISETFILSQVTGLIDRGQEVEIFAERDGHNSVVHAAVDRYRLRECTRYAAPKHENPVRALIGVASLLLVSGARAPRLTARLLWALRSGPHAFWHRGLRALIPLLGRPDYDVIHCHFGPSGVLGAALREAGVIEGKLVTTFYGFDVSSFVRIHGPMVYRHLFRRGQLFLALSSSMQHKLIELGCPPEKTTVHHLGVALARFPFRPRRLGADQVMRVVTVARLTEKKGIEFGIQAISRLIASGRLVNYEIVGDGPLRGQIEELIEEDGLRASVQLLGWKSQDAVRKALGAAHILMMPSVTGVNGDEEGTPTAILEAMASGLPILATSHGGIPEQVADGVNGYLVREADVDALAAKLRQLDDEHDQWEEMGRNGRRIVQEGFDATKLSQRLLSLYATLLN